MRWKTSLETRWAATQRKPLDAEDRAQPSQRVLAGDEVAEDDDDEVSAAWTSMREPGKSDSVKEGDSTNAYGHSTERHGQWIMRFLKKVSRTKPFNRCRSARAQSA
jgi:hypothetical protein